MDYLEMLQRMTQLIRVWHFAYKEFALFELKVNCQSLLNYSKTIFVNIRRMQSWGTALLWFNVWLFCNS